MALAESSLETKFRKEVAKRGGKAIKFTGLIHYPDRQALFPGGVLIWVEMKADKEPRKGQLENHRRLRAMGFRVDVIKNDKELKEWLNTLPHFTHTKTLPIEV